MTVNGLAFPLHVHMTGSEWFSTRSGGLNRYFTSLYEALHRRGDMIVTAAAFGEAPVGAASWGPAQRPLPSRYVAARRRVPATAHIVDRHFALYGGKPPSGVPLVVHFQGPWATESLTKGDSMWSVRLKAAFEKRRYHQAKALVVLSRPFKQILTEQYGIEESRVHVIPPGVDLRRFQPLESADGAPSVLCVRRLERRMGIDVLLRAWPHVKREVRHASLTIVGTGTFADELRAMAVSLDGVSFVGRVPDEALAEHYARASVTVVPSVALEGFGLIALESLAAGRPPVVTNCGGLPDAVVDLDPSLIVAVADERGLAARLIAALQGDKPDPGRCRAHAENFSWDVVAERHVTLYRGAIA